MSQSHALPHDAGVAGTSASAEDESAQKRRILNAVWQPFLQFKLLIWMLGSTALVALLLGAFLYVAFSDLIAVISGKQQASGYYGDMIEIQLVHVFRYCGALFVLYVLLLAAVCVAYTHRLIGPLRPFVRHVENMTAGDYESRVRLRKGDLNMYQEYADRLNELAAKLETDGLENEGKEKRAQETRLG